MNHALIFRLMATLGLIILALTLGLGYGKPGWFFAIPLVAPLPGMLRNHRYTFAWTSMLVIFYLGWLASEVAAPQVLPWSIHVALVSSLACFVGCMMYVRVTRPDVTAETLKSEDNS